MNESTAPHTALPPSTFQFDSTAVRTFVANNGEPWFCANDVCTILGYVNDTDAIKKHCRDAGRAKRDISSGGQMREMTFINEGNLYRLIIKSRKRAAEKFEAWVCDEVLPAIRKQGGYINLRVQQAKATDIQPLTGRVSVHLAEYVALIKKSAEQNAQLAKLKTRHDQTKAKISVAEALMNEGHYSREEIANISCLHLHLIDFLFSQAIPLNQPSIETVSLL